MIKQISSIFTAILLGSCAATETNKLVGTWKSNEEMTLASMAQAEDLKQEAIDLFNKDFFGKLIVEYKEKESRSYFDTEEENVPEMYEFYPYKIVAEGPDYMELEWVNWLTNEIDTSTIYFEGECYYMKLNKFNEYFCRTK
jgi:hypothetical protein